MDREQALEVDVAPATGHDGPIAALRHHLEAEGVLVGDADENDLLVWFEVDEIELLDGSVLRFDDPMVSGIFFTAPDDENDEWLVVLETPVIVAPGKLGAVERALDKSGVEWQFEVEEGAARLLIGEELQTEPWDGLSVCRHYGQLFIDLVAEFHPTGLRFAGFDAEKGDPRTPGFHEVHLGEEALQDERLDDAERYFLEARRRMESAEQDKRALFAEAARGIAVFLSGRLDDAHRILSWCRRELPPAERCDEQERSISAEIAFMLGQTYYFRGELDKALDSLNQAEQLDPEVDGLAWFRSYLSMRLPGELSTAADALVAEERLSGIRGDDRAEAETMVALSMYSRRVGDRGAAVGWLEQAEDRYARLGDHFFRAGVLAELIMLRLADRDTKGAGEAVARLSSLPDLGGSAGRYVDVMSTTVRSMHDRIVGREGSSEIAPGPDGFVGMVTLGLDDMWRSMLQRPNDAGFDEQVAMLYEALETVRTIGDESAQAMALAAIGNHRLSQAVREHRTDLVHQAGLALDEFLEAIRIHDRVRHQLTDVEDRAAFNGEILGAYEQALLIACDLVNDKALAAELLARVKVVGLPDQLGVASTGLLPVLEPLHVSVGGRSRLGPEGASLAPLEDRVVRQGGPGAWWWSMWLGDAYLHWALVGPAGELDAGGIALGPESLAGAVDDGFSLVDGLLGPVATEAIKRRFHAQAPIGEALDRLRADLPAGGSGSMLQEAPPVTGLLGPDHEASAELFLELGLLMLPQALREALDAASRREPIRLVVDPAPSLAWLPLGLLGVEAGGGRGPLTVLERAMLVYAPAVEATPRDRPGDANGTFAVLDPENDLPDMRALARRAASVLGGAELADDLELGTAAVANRDRMLTVLADGARYRRLLYAGHGIGVGDEPLDAGLSLGLDGPESDLSVGTLIESAPMLQCPEVVLLVACSSGRESSVIQERWGLATGFILAGARAVMVTGWEVRSCPFTAEFVLELLTELERSDVADALRRVQLRRLDEWRRHLETGATVGSDGSTPYPYHWASYQVAGWVSA